jgi:hypothetical protein
VLTLLLAGAVVVNTLFARTLFWAHVDDLNGVSVHLIARLVAAATPR